MYSDDDYDGEWRCGKHFKRQTTTRVCLVKNMIDMINLCSLVYLLLFYPFNYESMYVGLCKIERTHTHVFILQLQLFTWSRHKFLQIYTYIVFS